jgi:polysaccharide export outer membrane protein
MLANAIVTTCSIARGAESGAKPVMDVYRIHINDEMEISVYGNDELNKTVTVRPDGMISFPLIEDMYVLGKTTREIRAELGEALDAHVKHAKIALLMTRFHKPQVYILGEISAPGPYELTNPFMMFNLLAQARLAHPRMDEHKVIVVRDGISMPVALKSGSSELPGADTFQLKDGDGIYVSYQGTTSVYVLGDVPAPGFYPIPEDPANLIGLLASAKALDVQIYSADITLIRHGIMQSIPVKSPPRGFELLPYDVVLIKPAKKESLTVTGYVNSPGIYPYVEGQTLLDVITLSGGFSADAAEQDVIITRDYPLDPKIIRAGYLNRINGDIPALFPGDVISVPKRKASTKDFFLKKALPVIRDIAIISRVLNN